VKKWEHLIDTLFFLFDGSKVRGLVFIVLCLIDWRMSKPIFDIVGSVVWWKTGLASGK
jgi:uncharacterized membrane protein